MNWKKHKLPALLMLMIVVYSCASMGTPDGGPYDEEPPKFVRSSPKPYATNNKDKKIAIEFDEFIKLEKTSEKVVVSPPQLEQPDIKASGRRVLVNLMDSLKPNTTYTIDFSDAIVDNNEGNPLGYYRYVFSTGDIIDTLEVSGNVVNAESYEPMMNILVGLYEDQADSVPLLQLPDYIARTDSAGFFRLTNLRQAHYRVMAIDDKNKDKKYAPEVEMFGYLDSTVFPIVMPMVRTDTFRIIEQISGRDTITRDSIVTTEYLGYGPGNLYIRMFQEKLTQLYLVDSDRKDREKLDFILMIKEP